MLEYASLTEGTSRMPRPTSPFHLRSCVALTVCVLLSFFAPVPVRAQTGGSVPKDYILGPETLVSNNTDGGELRCEPSVGISGSDIVVAWNDSWGGAHGALAGTAVAWAYSRDAGKTFRFGGYLPEAVAGQAPDAADSQIVTDAEGNFYLEILSWQKTSQSIFVYFMDHRDIGRWQRFTSAATVDSSHGALLDRPFLSIDRSGILGLAFTMGTGADMQIGFSTSRDKSATWSAPVNVFHGATQPQGGASVVRMGDEVLVAWFGSGYKDKAGELWYAISNDGGKSFAEPKLFYRENKLLGVVPGYVMGFSPQATFGLSPSYTALAATGSNAASPAFSLASTDRSETGLYVALFQWDDTKRVWSGPVDISAGGQVGLSFFPALTRFGTSDAIVNYFRPGATPTALTDVLLTIRNADGLKHIKLNSVSSDWAKVPGDKEHAPVQRNFGDYISVAASGNRLAAVWTDGRDGVPRIYCRVVERSSN